MKPKISIVMPDEPAKFGKGYQVLAYYRVNALKRNYNLEIISISPSITFFNKIEHKYLNGVKVIKYYVGLPNIILNILCSFIAFKPLLSALYRSLSIKNYLLNSKSCCYIFYLSRAYVDINVSKSFTIVEFVDSMYKNFLGRSLRVKGLKSLLYIYEAYSSRRFESNIAKKVDLATAVSAEDAQIISKNVITAPIGVECINPKNKKIKSKYITFSGKMNYEPNKEAVIWFYKNVWLDLSKNLKNYKFKILGAHPPKELLELVQNDDSVIVTGYVKSLTTELSKSKISVAPMLSGSGMQFKILEAMSCSVPVITTPRGLGDIKARNGNEILIAETAEQFKLHIKNLIEDSEFSNKVTNNAIHFIENNHLWKNLNKSFYEKIMFLNK